MSYNSNRFLADRFSPDASKHSLLRGAFRVGRLLLVLLGLAGMALGQAGSHKGNSGNAPAANRRTGNGSTAHASHARLSPEVLTLDPDETRDFIVQFSTFPSDQDLMKMAALGAQPKRQLGIIQGSVVGARAGLLPALLDLLPSIEYVSLDRPVSAALDYAPAAINAPLAWQSGSTGEGVGIAVIDSGVYLHPDLQSSRGNSRVVFRASEMEDNPNDEFGHGTHVAGIIAGNGNASNGTFRGVAYKANIVSIRVLDEHGQGKDSDIIDAIEQAVRLKKRYRLRIINLSLGRPVFESYTLDPLCQAVKEAWEAGLVVVVAAGNEGRNNSVGNQGYATITSPGNSPYVITVGAMKTMATLSRNDDVVASYSSKGPTAVDHIVKPDVVAPGNRIASLAVPGSALAGFYPENLFASSYFRLSGTSMAAPIVSGAVALLLEREPGLTPDQVKARIMRTASKQFPETSIATDPTTGETFVSQYDVFAIGAGYLDIRAALSDSEVATASALSPSAMYDEETGNVYFVTDSSTVWGSSTTWGTTTVWGTNVLTAGTSTVWGSTAVWGTSSAWGDSSSSGFSTVWGSGTVWGSTTVWGTNTTIKGEK